MNSNTSLRTAIFWRAVADFEQKHPKLSKVTRILAIAFQLGLLIIAVYQFNLISRAFLYLCILTFAGFLVHSLLPMRYRLGFFFVLSLAGLVVVLGWRDATWLAALGFMLISLCHLPVPIRVRVSFIVLVAIALGVLRALSGAGIVPAVVLVLLGSMFMFRMIVYLYDLPSEKPTVSRIWPMSYFFLLPNVCFPLFPVVDYKQFRRTYYDQPEDGIYQRGITWMFRGVYHLLIYRVVYLYFTLDPVDVSGAWDLFQYSVSSFLLYLHVSGTFHLIVGMLLLFGFNLPETHHHYYLASSFTDFWRRINIYWKDFMRRIVFFPANFRLRVLGRIPALMLSTVIVFFGTWIFHSYQWFFLTGTILFESHDILFWATLGMLVAITMLYEDKSGTQPTWGRGRWDLVSGTALVCRTAATFITICMLWGMWSADSLAQWLAMWAGTGRLWIIMVAVVAVLYLISFALQRRDRRIGVRKLAPKPVAKRFWATATGTAVTVIMLLAIGNPAVYGYLGPVVGNFIDVLRTDQLNARDRKNVERSYYGTLMSADLTSGLIEHYTRRHANIWLEDTDAWGDTPDMRMAGLVPGARATFDDWTISVNSLGLRDQEYSQIKPADTHRVAFVGASHVMGARVEDDETFESLLEMRVISERESQPEKPRFESLNFGVGGRSALQSLYALQHQVVLFEPDTIILIAHEQDDEFMSQSISKIVRAERPIPYPSIRNLLATQEIVPSMPESVIELRVNAIMDDLLREVYREFAATCRSRGIWPVWIYLPMTYERNQPAEWTARAAFAQEEGFTVLSLEGIYDNYSPEQIEASSLDSHPNALAHGLIADRLYTELTKAGILSK